MKMEKSGDWSKLARGMPSTAGIKDPDVKRVCDSIAQSLKYLIAKVQDIRVLDETLPRTDVTKRPKTTLQ